MRRGDEWPEPSKLPPLSPSRPLSPPQPMAAEERAPSTNGGAAGVAAEGLRCPAGAPPRRVAGGEALV